MANGKLGYLGNLGNIIPSFLISEFWIFLYSQNRKLRFKNLGKNSRDFRGFRVFDLASFALSFEFNVFLITLITLTTINNIVKGIYSIMCFLILFSLYSNDLICFQRGFEFIKKKFIFKGKFPLWRKIWKCFWKFFETLILFSIILLFWR